MDNPKPSLFNNISPILYYITKENLILDVLYFLQELMANRKAIGIKMAM